MVVVYVCFVFTHAQTWKTMSNANQSPQGSLASTTPTALFIKSIREILAKATVSLHKI